MLIPVLAGAFQGTTNAYPYAYDGMEGEGTLQTMALLHAAHNVDPVPSRGGGDIMTVEDKALLADSGPTGTLADLGDVQVNPGNVSLYVVREGDNISEIAKMFNVTADTIRSANDLRGSTITPGDVLVILPISGVSHTVEKGDTITEIADRYDADADKILEYNGIDEAALAVGEKITIPEGKLAGHSTTRSVSSGGSYYIRPLKGGYKSQGIHGYNAVDLAANVGTPIYAAASGEVEESRHGGWNGGYGKMIVIRHDNGTKSLYAHNNSNVVDTGQWVVQGQVIGYVGNTGKSTGPHLHFEIRGANNPF